MYFELSGLIRRFSELLRMSAYTHSEVKYIITSVRFVHSQFFRSDKNI